MLGYIFAIVIGAILIGLAFVALGAKGGSAASPATRAKSPQKDKPVQMDRPAADEATPDRSNVASQSEVEEAKKRTPPGVSVAQATVIMRKLPKIFLKAAKNWFGNDDFKHCAAVSFYTLFSIAPITVIAVTVAGFFIGKEQAAEQYYAQVAQLAGKSVAETMKQAADATQASPTSPLMAVVGVGILLFGATTVFAQLQTSINAIWSVRAKPSRAGWMVVVVQRLVSFAMVVTVGFILLVSLFVTTVLSAVVGRFNTNWAPVLAQAAEFALALGIVTGVFALMFKVLPDVRLRWRDVGASALITAGLFAIGRYAIALYLSTSTATSIYGAAGSLVAMLFWVFLLVCDFVFGVEFTRAYCEAQGIKVRPKEAAVLVREEIVEERARKR